MSEPPPGNKARPRFETDLNDELFCSWVCTRHHTRAIPGIPGGLGGRFVTEATQCCQTQVWFTYNRAYTTAASFDSIWRMSASGTQHREVYNKIIYETQHQGQFLGAIELEPTSQTLFVVTYKQNSGGRSVFRLPMARPARRQYKRVLEYVSRYGIR